MGVEFVRMTIGQVEVQKDRAEGLLALQEAIRVVLRDRESITLLLVQESGERDGSVMSVDVTAAMPVIVETDLDLEGFFREVNGDHYRRVVKNLVTMASTGFIAFPPTAGVIETFERSTTGSPDGD